jgi:hypothetical protein
MSKPLNIAWTKHLKDKDKEDFEVIVRNSTRLLKRLKEIAEEKETEVMNTSLSLNDFSTPNWSHKTAYRNGQLSVLRLLKELIPF